MPEAGTATSQRRSRPVRWGRAQVRQSPRLDWRCSIRPRSRAERNTQRLPNVDDEFVVSCVFLPLGCRGIDPAPLCSPQNRSSRRLAGGESGTQGSSSYPNPSRRGQRKHACPVGRGQTTLRRGLNGKWLSTVTVDDEAKPSALVRECLGWVTNW